MTPTKGLSRAVAEGAAFVADKAQHVRIAHEKIPAYAELILSRYSLVSQMDPAMHYASPDTEMAARYVLALDSVNFGSGYFYLYPGLEYAALAGGLKQTFEQDVMSSPTQWQNVTPAFFANMLNIPATCDLARFYAEHLQAMGEIILAKYQGRVLHLIEEAQGSAAKLADIAASWLHFRDEAQYLDRTIPIYKRAQILAADMNLALGGLTDMDQLTIFADNMVPHVLRCDGVLSYDDTLATKIAAGTLIEAGSTEETELRACAIHAVERMRDAAQAAGHIVTAVNFDHLLWTRGYEPDLYKLPSHRTLTTAY